MTTRVTKNKTQLFKGLQKLRIDHEISRAQMARDLKITDKNLALIESGKIEACDALLQSIANRYTFGSAEGDDLIFKLRVAAMNSIGSMSFDMTTLDYSQKYRLMEIRRTFEAENLEELRLAELAKKEARASKAKSRSPKAEAVADEPKESPNTTILNIESDVAEQFVEPTSVYDIYVSQGI